MSIHRKSTGVWYVSYRDSNGKQRTASFGRGKAGKDAAAVRDLEIKREKKLGREIKAANQVYIDDLTQAYVNDLRLNGKSKAFVDQIISLINNHLGPLINHKPVDKLTYAEVTQRVMEYGESRGTSNRTIQKHLRYLRTIFRFGTYHDMINVNPLEKWRGKKYPPKPVNVTLEDLQRIKERPSASPMGDRSRVEPWYTPR